MLFFSFFEIFSVYYDPFLVAAAQAQVQQAQVQAAQAAQVDPNYRLQVCLNLFEIENNFSYEFFIIDKYMREMVQNHKIKTKFI